MNKANPKSTIMSIYYDRRDFVKKVAGSALAIGMMGKYSFASPLYSSAYDKITVAVIGTNSRGAALAGGFARIQGIEVKYICDVDENAALKGLKAVKDAGQKMEAKVVSDFRKILDDSQ
jgi:hypothetical protein